jgi:hypothetical protein
MRVIRWIGASLILPAAIIAIAWAFGAVWFDAPFDQSYGRMKVAGRDNSKDRIRHSTRLSLTRTSGFFADQHCSRYIVGTRGKGEVSTGTNHLGFRCVKDKVDKRVHEATTKVLLPKPFLLKES